MCRWLEWRRSQAVRVTTIREILMGIRTRREERIERGLVDELNALALSGRGNALTVEPGSPRYAAAERLVGKGMLVRSGFPYTYALRVD